MSDEQKSSASAMELWFQPSDHPAFFECFSEAEREQMIVDDLEAGRWVPRLLTTIITMGVVLAATSVWLMM